MSNNSPSIDENIRVYIRQRPLANDEIEEEGTAAINLTSDGSCSYTTKGGKNEKANNFKFNGCFLPTTSQQDVYDLSAKPIVDSALLGYSGTIFAYGPTNSGKTYTMRGVSGNENEQGIMERCVAQLLSSLSGGPGQESGKLFVSYVQIYCEMVTDLLDKDGLGDAAAGYVGGDAQLSIREKDGKVFVEGLKRAPLKTMADFTIILAHGDANRKIAETNMNATSSRSHTALMMTILIPEGEQDSNNTGAPAPKSYKESTLFLVDLAGSERATASAGQQYQRLVEGKAINLSLSSLGNCMNALAEKRKHVPYRDSKLTRLLQGSLGGGARTSVIVTIPPGDSDSDKMILPVLRFASRATKVVVSANISRYIDYESLYNAAQRRLDTIEQEKNSSLIAAGLRDDLQNKIDLQTEEIVNLKDDNALLTRQLEAYTGGSSRRAGGQGPDPDGGNSSSSEGKDQIDIENYWRAQMNTSTEKVMEDMKSSRSKFEAKIRTLNRDMDKASTEILSLQNELNQERTKHLATVGQAKQFQQKLMSAESELQGRIEELLAERVEIAEVLESSSERARTLEKQMTEMRTFMRGKQEDMIPKAQFEELETLFCDTVERLTNRVMTLEANKKDPLLDIINNEPESSGSGSRGNSSQGQDDPNRYGLNLSATGNSKRIQPGGRVMSNARASGSAPAARGSRW